MIFAFLCLTYFTQYGNLQFHPCCCKWHCFVLFFLIFFNFYIFIFLISHQFYAHQCIHVNPNRPIQHTPIPTPLRFSPLGVHTFVLYIRVSTSALRKLFCSFLWLSNIPLYVCTTSSLSIFCQWTLDTS